MNAPKVMIDALHRVPKGQRYMAARIAEKVFFDHLAKNIEDGEFEDSECIEMAAEAAAAELASFT